MFIKCFPEGPLGANMYLLWSNGSYFIVDPCCSPNLVKDITDIQDFDFKCLKAIFITHGHFDHIACVDEWKGEFPEVPIYIDDDEKDTFADGISNGSAVFGRSCTFSSTPELLSSINYSFDMGLIHIEMIKTPGHSKGSVCYIASSKDENNNIQRAMFSGDMLFRFSIGRTDLPGGNDVRMHESIVLLKKLDFDCVVLPGHGGSTTLGQEKRLNPYF